ncbi:MAG: type II secretion system protein [Gemmatimonadota bacterium]|nr:MAG: type II secretion system protein [Gemmatimonadota bacterium]
MNAKVMVEERGTSLVEILVVLGAFAALFVIAVPGLTRARARVEASAARQAFAASHALARQIAAQYGRLSYLHVDPQSNRFWVTSDTSNSPGRVAIDTIGPIVRVDDRFAGVTLEGTARTFCFDPRGLATARGACGLPNATVVFRAGSVADTVTISRLGRLLKR